MSCLFSLLLLLFHSDALCVDPGVVLFVLLLVLYATTKTHTHAAHPVLLHQIVRLQAQELVVPSPKHKMLKEMPSNNKRNKIRTRHTRKENFHVNRLNMLMDRHEPRRSAGETRSSSTQGGGEGVLKKTKKRIKQTLYDDVVLLGGYSIEK